MSKENKKQIQQQTAQEIAKDIFKIFDEHIKKTTVYGDGDIMCVRSTVNDVSFVVNAVNSLFKDKYDIKVGKSLNDYTWQEIKEAANEGYADKIFAIGDTKTIQLYTGETIELVIIGFNHDKISGSNDTAGITFALKNMLDGEFEMNEDNTNVGGWAKSKMRNVYMQRFFKLLPTDLQEIIETVDKITGVGGGSEQIESTQDKLFLFSKREITGDSNYVAPMEGKQYPYFENEDNRIKQRAGSAYGWWLRSPNVTNTTYFGYISSGGDVNSYVASAALGVSFGFCI